MWEANAQTEGSAAVDANHRFGDVNYPHPRVLFG